MREELVNTQAAFLGGGTFAPERRASESPIAIACLGFVTFLPLRPLFNLPRLNSCISVSTCFCAFGLYFRPLLEEDFFAEELRRLELFFDVPRWARLELLLLDDRLPPVDDLLRLELRPEDEDFDLRAVAIGSSLLIFQTQRA